MGRSRDGWTEADDRAWAGYPTARALLRLWDMPWSYKRLWWATYALQRAARICKRDAKELFALTEAIPPGETTAPNGDSAEKSKA
jgi:hypothetical protein